MADPKKFKSVSVSIRTYQILDWLRKGKIVDVELTISKTIESLATRQIKKLLIVNDFYNEKNLEVNNVGQEATKPTENLIFNKI